MITIEESDKRFSCGKSTLPNAGYGCFANEPIKKGDWLEIIGVMVLKNSVADLCTHYAHRYKFAGSQENSKIVPMGWAGLINHTNDKSLQNVAIVSRDNLPKRSEHASSKVYTCLRDIETGEELLGYYGDEYDGQIEKMADNLEFLEKNKSDWDVFMEFDLYNLKKFIAAM